MSSRPRSLERYLTRQVRADLARKMVFVGGPRQVGKTTFCRAVSGQGAAYLNWDDDSDRERILRRDLPDARTLIFDELHKFRGWRNFLKGLFDKRRPGTRILVSGSARLDLYRFGGDSLQGRYHYHRLHPLSVAELKSAGDGVLEDLLRFGGFPEPYLARDEAFSRRWSREYRTRLIRDDVASLERVGDLGRLELLMLALPDRVGAPLSLNALREDLQVSHDSVRLWVQVFERLYAIFRLPPFGAPRLRAVKKEQKHYHFDWTLVRAEGPRLENLVACHLLKWCHHLEDTAGREMELRYFRDHDGREVDFVLLEDRKPVLFLEVKRSVEPVSKALLYLSERFPSVRCVQVSQERKEPSRHPSGVESRWVVDFLRELV